MDFKTEEAKKLFLKYAIPCGHVLVKRGYLKEEKLERITKKLIENKKISENLEKIFPVGMRMCFLTAKRMKKKKIDENVIREYFWNEHEKAILWRSQIYPDIPESCKIVRGKVIKSGKIAKVLTEKGEIKAKTDFVKVFPGDEVIVHYDYIVEKNNLNCSEKR